MEHLNYSEEIVVAFESLLSIRKLLILSSSIFCLNHLILFRNAINTFFRQIHSDYIERIEINAIYRFFILNLVDSFVCDLGNYLQIFYMENGDKFTKNFIRSNENC